ncbi:MAG: PKD domain-containing protein [Verrucomicrobiota bacterium]|nr:PKD domain-containing protein [Verrucomicrobiota bacterium]
MQNRRRWLTGLGCLIGLTLLIDALHATTAKSPAPAQRGDTMPSVPTASTPMDSFRAWQSALTNTALPTASRLAQEKQGIALAKARVATLADWVTKDPERAMANALSAGEWAKLPPAVQAIVEKPIDTTGNYEVICFTPKHDALTGADEVPPDASHPANLDLVHRVRIGNKVYPALTYGAGNHAKTRKQIRIRGFILDGTFVVDERTFTDAATNTEGSSTDGRGTSELDAYNAIGSQSVLVIAVDFPDLTGDPLESAARIAGLATVEDFLEDSSLHELNLSFTTTPTLRLSMPSADYNNRNGSEDDLMNEAIQLAISHPSGNYNWNDYSHLVILFKDIGYPWAGLGYVGWSGCWVQVSDPDYWQLTTTHELGHNLGLSHAKAWNPTSTTNPLGAGAIVEYGNAFDNMGSGGIPEGVFSGNFQYTLGWLGSTDIITASSAASSQNTYTITRVDTGLSKIASRKYSLKIPVAKSFNGLTLDYWVDFRQRFTDRKEAYNGLVIQLGDNGGANGASIQLDISPETELRDDGGLEIGRTYTDTTANVSITPVALRNGGAGAEQIDIVVSRGPFAGNTAPTGTLSIPSYVKVWQPVELLANASDANGDTLAYYWNLGDGTANLNSATRLHTFTAGGVQSCQVTVSDMKGGTTTLAASPNVQDPAVMATQTLETTYYGPGLRVIGSTVYVPFSDNLATSTDGITWNTRTVSPSGNTSLQDIASSGSFHVVVGYDFDFNVYNWVGTLLTSSNLTTWTARNPNVTPKLNAVAYSNGVWVAVGASGAITRSTNGTSWAAVTSGSTASLNDIIALDGGFVVVGDSGTVLTSVDGQSWQSLASSTTNNLHNIDNTANTSTALINGTYAQLTLQWSSGGSPQVLRSGSMGYILYQSFYADGLYYAAGVAYDYDVSQWKSYLLRSIDGQNWVPSVLGFTGEIRNLGILGGKLLYGMVGSSGKGYQFTSSPIYDSRDNWLINAFPGSRRFDPTITALSADPDGDGLSNRLEFALGMNPLSGDMTHLPTGGDFVVNAGQPGEVRYGTITFRRWIDAASLGIQYIPEVSATLNAWQSGPTQTVEVSATANGDGSETVVVRTYDPVSPAQPRYMRLRVVD